jgi:hypothetical protein
VSHITGGPIVPQVRRTSSETFHALLGVHLMRGATSSSSMSTGRCRAVQAMAGLSGAAARPTLQALARLSLPVAGLPQPAERLGGASEVANISVPKVVYRRLGVSVGSNIARADIVRIRPPDDTEEDAERRRDRVALR